MSDFDNSIAAVVSRRPLPFVGMLLWNWEKDQWFRIGECTCHRRRVKHNPKDYWPHGSRCQPHIYSFVGGQWCDTGSVYNVNCQARDYLTVGESFVAAMTPERPATTYTCPKIPGSLMMFTPNWKEGGHYYHPNPETGEFTRRKYYNTGAQFDRSGLLYEPPHPVYPLSANVEFESAIGGTFEGVITGYNYDSGLYVIKRTVNGRIYTRYEDRLRLREGIARKANPEFVKGQIVEFLYGSVWTPGVIVLAEPGCLVDIKEFSSGSMYHMGRRSIRMISAEGLRKIEGVKEAVMTKEQKFVEGQHVEFNTGLSWRHGIIHSYDEHPQEYLIMEKGDLERRHRRFEGSIREKPGYTVYRVGQKVEFTLKGTWQAGTIHCYYNDSDAWGIKREDSCGMNYSRDPSDMRLAKEKEKTRNDYDLGQVVEAEVDFDQWVTGVVTAHVGPSGPGRQGSRLPLQGRRSSGQRRRADLSARPEDREQDTRGRMEGRRHPRVSLRWQPLVDQGGGRWRTTPSIQEGHASAVGVRLWCEHHRWSNGGVQAPELLVPRCHPVLQRVQGHLDHQVRRRQLLRRQAQRDTSPDAEE
jgi:hypothetical protein